LLFSLLRHYCFHYEGFLLLLYAYIISPTLLIDAIKILATLSLAGFRLALFLFALRCRIRHFRRFFAIIFATPPTLDATAAADTAFSPSSLADAIALLPRAPSGSYRHIFATFHFR
jgi:hypothetical protein